MHRRLSFGKDLQFIGIRTRREEVEVKGLLYLEDRLVTFLDEEDILWISNAEKSFCEYCSKRDLFCNFYAQKSFYSSSTNRIPYLDLIWIKVLLCLEALPWVFKGKTNLLWVF